MNSLLIIDTTWPINSRTQRFLQTLEGEFDVSVAAWNRGGNKYAQRRDNFFILDSDIRYGERLKKLFYLPLFFRHILQSYRNVRPCIIFASHWDSLVCAVLIKIFFGCKVKIVYDCLDLPTSKSKVVLFLLRFLEKALLFKVDLTVFASRYFVSLYRHDLKYIVFENYPSKASMLPCQGFSNRFSGSENFFNKKSVSWIGVVRYPEIIRNILLAIKGSDVGFLVFGDGPALNEVRSLVDAHGMSHQVIFFGRYEAKDLPHIYKMSSLVWAAYPTRDFNSVYAISNKYFECSFYGRVPVFSKKTMMAKYLSEKGGSVVLIDEYDVLDIRDKIICFLRSPSGSFDKYEADIFWEDRESLFLIEVLDLLKNK